jgi:hypothetical protein
MRRNILIGSVIGIMAIIAVACHGTWQYGDFTVIHTAEAYDQCLAAQGDIKIHTGLTGSQVRGTSFSRTYESFCGTPKTRNSNNFYVRNHLVKYGQGATFSWQAIWNGSGFDSVTDLSNIQENQIDGQGTYYLQVDAFMYIPQGGSTGYGGVAFSPADNY